MPSQVFIFITFETTKINVSFRQEEFYLLWCTWIQEMKEEQPSFWKREWGREPKRDRMIWGIATTFPPTAAHPDTFAYRLTTTPQTHTQNNHTVPTLVCGYNYISRNKFPILLESSTDAETLVIFGTDRKHWWRPIGSPNFKLHLMCALRGGSDELSSGH